MRWGIVRKGESCREFPATDHHIDSLGDDSAVRIALDFNGGLPQLELN